MPILLILVSLILLLFADVRFSFHDSEPLVFNDVKSITRQKESVRDSWCNAKAAKKREVNILKSAAMGHDNRSIDCPTRVSKQTGGDSEKM